jgi:phosphate transport system substrate-binding protein
MMALFRPSPHSSLLLASLALAFGCASKPGSEPTVTIDGSSTVFPITNAVAHQFQKAQPVKVMVKVPVGISGTGGGFQKFCVGNTDISDASRPINAEEANLCAKNGVEYIEVPIGYDGLAVLVNPKNTWASQITTTELKKIWEPEAERRITKWSQVREGWPERELHLYGAGTRSGTYDYFTQAIVQKSGVSRADFKSSEDDEVLVRGVAEDELALGFFGYAYLHKYQGTLKALAVDDGDPNNGSGAISPSPETVRNGTYQPLSRPLFIYVSKASLGRREVELFTAYYLSKATNFVERVGYVPLPGETYLLAHKRVIARRTGSIFGGVSQVGMSIEQLLRREETHMPSARSK